MRNLLVLWFCVLTIAVTPLYAGQAKPTTRARTTTLTVTVTDGTGAPLEGATIRAVGPVSRTGTTDAKGVVRFVGVRPGEYRVRAELDQYVTLERMVTVARTPQAVEMSLSPAPAPPEPEPAPEPEPEPAPPAAPPGDPASLVVLDFIERNFIGTRQDVQRNELGCTASAATTLVQVREPVAERVLPDADEVLYVVAGEGTLRLGNEDVPLKATSLAVIPRGTARGLTRKGRNPLILLSVVSGPPCTK